MHLTPLRIHVFLTYYPITENEFGHTVLIRISVFEKIDLPGLSCRPKHAHFPLYLNHGCETSSYPCLILHARIWYNHLIFWPKSGKKCLGVNQYQNPLSTISFKSERFQAIWLYSGCNEVNAPYELNIYGQFQDRPKRHGNHTISDFNNIWCVGLSAALISIFDLLKTSLYMITR